MSIFTRYFDAQINEIKKDNALRFYGAFLGVAQVLVFWAWHVTGAVNYISNEEEPFCWPFFENCFKYRFFGYGKSEVLIFFFAFVAIISILLFLSKKRPKLAYWWLFFVNLYGTLIYVQDFRLRHNQNYMLFFAVFVFLFLPNKRRLLRYTLVLFYFWASTLKYNTEWLSGAALYAKPLLVPDAFIPASCAYVVILESIIVWGLLSKIKWVYWAAFFQIALFHIESWPVVDFWYPLLMFCLLSIFPLSYFISDPGEEKSLLSNLVKGKEPVTTYLFIVFFSFLQLIPIIMPGDEKVTGEGRLFALNMFDARVSCEGAITLRFKDGTTKEFLIPTKEAPRITCDPVLYFTRAKRLCWENKNNPNFLDLDLQYKARRANEITMKPLVDVKDFCSSNISYDMLHPNKWIIKNR